MKARHKLVPAIAMLVVAAVVLSSASYAWFTMSRTVTATGIELTAIAPTNLLISNAADGVFAETTTVSESFTTGKLIPASSKNGLNFYVADQIKTANAGAPDATTIFAQDNTALTDAADGTYADFKLWLKTTGEDDVEVTVAQALTLVTSEATKALGDCARFAILDGAGTAVLGTNNVYGTNAGTSTVNYFGGLTGPIDAAGKGDPLYKGVAMTPNSDNVLFTCVGGDQGTDNTATAITVRVWIEGQDVECVSANANTSFEMTVGFRDTTFADPTTTVAP